MIKITKSIIIIWVYDEVSNIYFKNIPKAWEHMPVILALESQICQVQSC